MFSQWSALAPDQKVEFGCTRYPTSRFSQIIAGTATDGIDMSSYVERITQGPGEASITLAWHTELFEDAQTPKLYEVYAVTLNGHLLWMGICLSITDRGESRGQRRMTLGVKSRDQTSLWRDFKTSTGVYSLGTDFASIFNDIADFLSLEDNERLYPSTTGSYTPHTTTQMVEMSAWSMLQTISQVGGHVPYVDALGRLKLISRDLNQVPTRRLTAEDIVSVSGGIAIPAVSSVMVKWLSPQLTKVTNQDQCLANATLTAGFFQQQIDQDVYFSDDHSARAEDTRLVIKQSCNSGLIPVANEVYEQTSLTSGRISLISTMFAPLLATDSLSAQMLLASKPDLVQVGYSGTGQTIPWGRIMQTSAEVEMLLVMMSIGTGVYEVWGKPFDYVHETNRTEAYNPEVETWAKSVKEISNDFVPDEVTAQAMAVRELFFETMSAESYTAELVDDPSLEVGDIIQFPNSTMMYVTGYNRDIVRGQVHKFTVNGFLV